jgi:DUF4097 and DUF4098 domain-containing protein YvlB
MHPSIRAVVPVAAALLLVPVCAFAAEGTFDKTLTVNGTVMLDISTGSGNIKINPGSDNQVHIIGHVKSSNGWTMGSSNKSAEERVNEVVSNPPIEQTGNIIRVGKENHKWNNISISYEVTAPKNTTLTASTGSGDIQIQNVGVNAKLNTGSGNIQATGLSGTIYLETGSGDINASQNAAGDVKAGTGSGNVRLNNIQGGLKAETGSGNIDVSGKPSSGWKLGTGSGDVTIASNGAPFTLDASSGSGGIKTDVPITVEGSLDRHHVTGKVNGGGPQVRVETGSGSIHVQ